MSLTRHREASYYNVKIGDTDVVDAAWYILLPFSSPPSSLRRIGHLLTTRRRYYPAPKDAAAHIKDHVAFYKNKVIIKE